MKKILFTWALTCLTAIAVPARQATDGDNDSIRTVELGEVTVKARPIIVKDDRKVLLPTAGQVRMATSGINLLQRMQLPRITVNSLTGEIGMTGQGKVVLCINGVKVTSSEIAAIRPGDIIRIEYHDSPGARWGDADAVIDCIVRHYDTGGNINGELFDAVGNGIAGMNEIAATYNRGKSEWSLNVGSFLQTRDNWIREYDEKRVAPDGETFRHEAGEPVKIGMNSVRGNLNYSYADGGRLFFNAQLGYDLTHIPNSELGDRSNTLFTSDSDTPLRIHEQMKESSHSPSLDLYLRHRLGDNRQMIFDVAGTYIRTKSRRTYQESDAGSVITDVLSDVSGNKYSLSMEGAYEEQSGANKFTTGVRHMQSYTDNEYRGTNRASAAMHQSETSAYAELRHKAGKWGYGGNVTATRLYYSQDGQHTGEYVLQPSAHVSFEPCDGAYIKYKAELRTSAPSLSAMNDVVQEIDAGQVRRGNPDLDAFRTLDQELTAGYGGTVVSADLAISYRHEFHPIMESVTYENGLFVRTYENQKAFQRLGAELTLAVRPWKDHLSFSVSPLLYRYISRGNSYLHTHTMARLRWDFDFSYGNWMLSCNTFMGPENYMYGERFTEEKNMYALMVGYKRPSWSFCLGAFNPFLKEYSMVTTDYSALNPSTSKAYTRKNLYVLAKFSFNIEYGRQTRGSHRRTANVDTDAGIMKGTRK